MKTRGKQGYSLVEMVFVSLLGSLVLGQVIVALIWGQRIYRDVIAVSELTTASRMIRERTLYHLVNTNGGLASLDLKTCRIGSDRHDITFSIGDGAPQYQLAFDPLALEPGFDLRKVLGTGRDESAFTWSPLRSAKIDADSRFNLVRQGDNAEFLYRHGSDLSQRYHLANEFRLRMENGGHVYTRTCLIRSPIVNDFTK